MRQRTGVTTLGIIGGLLVLLMIAAAGCDDSEPEIAREPTAPSLEPTATATPAPTNTPTLAPTHPPTATLIPADTPTGTFESTATPTPTNAPTPGPTNTPTPTPPVGICDRTEQVRDVILARIDGVDDCKTVTAAHLATIDGEINLAGRDIGELQPGDFGGLTALETLDLRAASLTSLEAGVFDGLTSLTVLDLRGNWYLAYPDYLGSMHWNRLASLEEGLFEGLTSLRKLYLGDGNRLTSLKAGIFDDLGALEYLDLGGNRLTSVEAGIFDDLRALEYLDLGGNRLTSVEAGVFDRLISLTELKLSYFGETAPPQGLFDKLTSLRELSMGTDVASLEAGVLVGIPITRLSVSPTWRPYLGKKPAGSQPYLGDCSTGSHRLRCSTSAAISISHLSR